MLKCFLDQDHYESKKNTIAFYRMAYLGRPKLALDTYVESQHIQHNPDVADGKESFLDYFERMQREYTQKTIEFVRCIA